jgi:protein SCO1/2
MHRLTLFLVAVLVSVNGCSRPANTRQYELTGQILAVRTDRNEVLIKHEDIEGFMPGMTMPFTVKETELLSGKAAGDLVTATLVVGDTEAYLSSITKTGSAPVEAAPAPSSGPRILVPGEDVSDAALVDQDGQPRPFSSFRGHRVAITFIYTRCPLPDFCPLMDRHFAAVQKTLKSTPALADVRLLTVTLDPEYDTPQVLKPYARRLDADPAIWSFATGAPADVAAFAGQFGLHVEQNPANAADLLHNLRTVVVDPTGRLAHAHSGNDWTPSQLVADLHETPAPGN